MLRMTPSCPVYLAVGPTDLRNNIDGLIIKIKYQFNLDPFQAALFVFCNKSRNKLKIIFWDKNGFWLYYRRLDSGTFNWPQKTDNKKTLAVTEQQLSWILDGLSMDQKGSHPEVLARKLI